MRGTKKGRVLKKFLYFPEKPPFTKALFFLFFTAFLVGALTERSSFCVGVVDLPKVLSSYKKWQKMTELLELRRKKRSEEIQALKEEVDSLRRKAESLDPKSSAYAKLQAELIKKETYMETISRQYDYELRRAEETQFLAVLKEIERELKVLAEEKDLKVVVQRTLELPERSLKIVLYCQSQLNLTEELIERLNRKERSNEQN